MKNVKTGLIVILCLCAILSSGLRSRYDFPPIYWNTAGNVGIGTTAPDGTLEVNMGTSGQVRFSYNDADGSAIDYAKFELASDGALTITTVDDTAASADIALMPDGNVSIGTTLPVSKFEVKSADAVDVRNRGTYVTADVDGSHAWGKIFYRSRDGEVAVQVGDFLGGNIFLGNDGTNPRIAAAIFSITESISANTSVGGGIAFYTGTGTGDITSGSFTGTTEKVRITKDGNVGIGTTTPTGSSTAGTSVLALIDGTAPVGGRNLHSFLYADDVGDTTEMFAMDEGGTAAQLTDDAEELYYDSNYGAYIPTARIKLNPYAGIRQRLDIWKLAKAVEEFTGKKIIDIQKLPAENCRDWDTDQQVMFEERKQERLIAQAQIAALEKEINLIDPNDIELIAKKKAEKDAIEVKPKYKKKKEPNWIKEVRKAIGD